MAQFTWVSATTRDLHISAQFLRAATHIYGANLASAVHFVSEHHAMMPLTTCPDTSVSLKSRPLYR